MEEKNAEDNEVQLVLRDSRVIANKDALARNSLYFAALFSENFRDHQQKEFEVNYDISLSTLQTFVKWANNEGEDAKIVHLSRYHFDVSAPLKKYINGSHNELLKLLNLSVVFAAEKLTEDIADMIICTKFRPNFMLDLWLLADELQLKNLRDVAFASCLDRFQELSISCLRKLSKKNFFKLVLNRNINCCWDHVLNTIELWQKTYRLNDLFGPCCSESSEKNNMSKGDKVGLQPDSNIHTSSDEQLCNLIEIVTSDIERASKIYNERKPRVMPSVVGRRMDNSLFVWAWDVEKCEFNEIAEMTNEQMHKTLVDNGKNIVGRQVIGRAYSIYVIGGEQGIGTGHFNTTLWRYCLFYKKWYIETVLPQPRRHMAVAFLENKLYLFGGVGRHRVKLYSVDVYDIHTGIWSRAAKIIEAFTEVPPSCVVDGKFVYHKSDTYVYNPMSDRWDLFRVCGDHFFHGRMLLSCVANCTVTCSPSYFDSLPKIFRNDPKKDLYVITQQILNDPWIIRVGCTDDGPYIDVSYFYSDSWRDYKKIPISFGTSCTELTSLPEDAFQYRLGIFNIVDPQKLHEIISSDVF